MKIEGDTVTFETTGRNLHANGGIISLSRMLGQIDGEAN